MQTQAEIGPLIERWMAFELNKDLISRADTSWASLHAQAGEEIGMVAARMLHSEALSALDHWIEIVNAQKWEAAEALANAFIAENDLKIEKGTSEHFRVRMLLALAKAEVCGEQVERSEGRWSGRPSLPYGLESGGLRSHQPKPTPVTSEYLSVLIPEFIKEQNERGGWGPKRDLDFKAALNLFARWLKRDMPVAEITRSTIGEFRSVLIQIPKHYTKRYPGMSLDEILAKAKAEVLPTLTSQTINTKYLGILERFFAWCMNCGKLVENPAKGIRVTQTKDSDKKVRKPFDISHLNALFRVPLYAGCRSDTRIYEPGSHLVRNHRYWLPLLGLFTGARLGELCQLRVVDVRQVGLIWCLDITTEGGGRLKTKAAKRIVPLHPKLLELGFLRYVAEQRKNAQSHIFPEIAVGSSGYVSDNPSKWFQRLLRKSFGAELKRTAGMTFHSFRHTMIDAMRAAGVEYRVQDALIGHETDHHSDGYGEGYKPPRLFQEIEKVIYSGLDLSHLVAAK